MCAVKQKIIKPVQILNSKKALNIVSPFLDLIHSHLTHGMGWESHEICYLSHLTAEPWKVVRFDELHKELVYSNTRLDQVWGKRLWLNHKLLVGNTV